MLVLLAGLYLVLWSTLLTNFWYLYQRSSLGTLPETPPTVSILVPARNEAANLKRLLPSLLKQSYPSFEIILYDDASSDGSRDYLDSISDARLKIYRGHAPPSGWLGKVYALFRASCHAEGQIYLFLDADAVLTDDQALTRLVRRKAILPESAVLTGLPKLTGSASLIVSLVPNAILAALPWMLVRRVATPELAALNGQCWMIDSKTYHRLEPHRAVKAEILEDVEIGRYLKAHDIIPEMVDVQQEVHVRMYDDFRSAWRGFRKNAYLVMGGNLSTFIPLFLLFVLLFLVTPYLHVGLFITFISLKAATDWRAGIPLWVSLLAPLSYFVAVLIQIDSAWHHLQKDVSWKGRVVSE